jgi:succinoglycan biosynthesis protein ExoO
MSAPPLKPAAVFHSDEERNSKVDPAHSPLVSVVMPVYNGARTLIEAVDSVLAQTHSYLELIICNDASTDETPGILSKITDPRVRIIHNETNLGAGPARDRAIQKTRGVWIAVIDADDTWDVVRLSALMQHADVSENIIIFDDILECHDTASGMVPWRVLRGNHAFGGNGVDAVSVPVADFIASSRLLIKPLMPSRLIQQRIVHSRRRFAEDTEFFLQLMATGTGLRYVPRALYNYRITPDSATAGTDRNTLMREVLENAAARFEHVVDIQNALRRKIDMVARDETYMPFVWALKQKQLRKAIQLACRSPWLIPEFFRRSTQSLAYNIHRVRYGGRSRGIR